MSFLAELRAKKAEYLQQLKARLREIHKSGIAWIKIAEHLGLHPTELSRFINTDVGLADSRLARLEEFLEEISGD